MSLVTGVLAAALGLFVGPPAAAAPSRTELLFRLADPRIIEASGLAAGHRSRGVDYVQNDGGDTNRVFAIDARTGATAATITVSGATNVDWEDLAVGPDSTGASSLWVADVGDNKAIRPEIRIYRVREPLVRSAERGRQISTARAEVWRLRYPDGATDAESMAVGPDGIAYVITKSVFGRSVVYRVPARPDRGRIQVLQRVGRIYLLPRRAANPFGAAGELAVTGAAISPDGSVFAVRTYAEAHVWRVAGGDVAAALKRTPARVALPQQPQGEGIALPGDGMALIDSEGRHSAVYAVRLPALPPVASGAASSAASSPAPGRRAPAAEDQDDDAPWQLLAGLAAGVAALGAAAWGWCWSKIRACRSPRSTKP